MKTRSMETTVFAKGATRAMSVVAYSAPGPFPCIDGTRLNPAVQSRNTAASTDNAHESLDIALERWENEGGRVSRLHGIVAADVNMEQE